MRNAVRRTFGGRCGSRTRRSFRLRQFSGLLGMPVPNLPRVAGAPGFEPGSAGLESASLTLSLRPLSMHQEGLEPPRSLPSHSFTGCCRAFSASDARSVFVRITRRRRKKTTKAGRARRAYAQRSAGPTRPAPLARAYAAQGPRAGKPTPRLHHLKVIRLSNSKKKERTFRLP